MGLGVVVLSDVTVVVGSGVSIAQSSLNNLSPSSSIEVLHKNSRK